MSCINWKVEDYEVHQAGPYALPSVEVSLSGFVKNVGAYKSRSNKEIVQEIERRLNYGNRPRVSYVDYARKDIKDVIFNPPATIVFWMDGTKTVVKCQEDDIYDPEKGLAMAISKKALGNKGNYCNEMKKWLGKYDPPALYPTISFDGSPFVDAITKVASEMFGNLVDKRIAEKKAERKENK